MKENSCCALQNKVEKKITFTRKEEKKVVWVYQQRIWANTFKCILCSPFSRFFMSVKCSVHMKCRETKGETVDDENLTLKDQSREVSVCNPLDSFREKLIYCQSWFRANGVRRPFVVVQGLIKSWHLCLNVIFGALCFRMPQNVDSRNFVETKSRAQQHLCDVSVIKCFSAKLTKRKFISTLRG